MKILTIVTDSIQTRAWLLWQDNHVISENYGDLPLDMEFEKYTPVGMCIDWQIDALVFDHVFYGISRRLPSVTLMHPGQILHDPLELARYYLQTALKDWGGIWQI